MSRFNFEYESVLEHRRNMEDIAQCELAKLLRERMVLDSQLRALERAVREDGAVGVVVGAIDVAAAQRHAGLAMRATVRRRQIDGRIGALDRRITAARRRLDEALRRRKAIERLRDKRRGVWETQQRRRETIDCGGALCPM